MECATHHNMTCSFNRCKLKYMYKHELFIFINIFTETYKMVNNYRSRNLDTITNCIVSKTKYNFILSLIIKLIDIQIQKIIQYQVSLLSYWGLRLFSSASSLDYIWSNPWPTDFKRRGNHNLRPLNHNPTLFTLNFDLYMIQNNFYQILSFCT